MRSWWEGAGAGQLQPGWELVLSRGAGHGGGLCMPKGSLHTVPGAWDHGEVQAYRSCTVQGSTRARRCRPRSLAGSPRPLRKTTVGPHSSPTPAGRNTSACPQDCCLPHWPSGQISGMVRPSSGPSPSSSDTSRISSTVSGKLMRCLSLTDCGSRAESEDASLHAQARHPAVLSGPLPGCCQPQPSSTGSWSQSPGAHRDVGFLCDDLQHVCDRNVAKPLCYGQGSGAILCKEEGLGQQQPQGSPGRCPSLPRGEEVRASAVLTVLISLGEAPCFSSSVTTSVWPCCAAWCRGV